MPYTVALPDGRVVEFPDNVPPDKAAELLRQQFPAPDAPSAPFSFGDVLASFGRGAVGSTKAITDAAGADNALSNKLEGVSKSLEEGMTPARRAELQRQAARSQRAAESGSMWEEIKAAAQNVAESPIQAAAEGVGSFVPYLPAMLAAPAGAAIGLGTRAVAAINTVAKFAPRVIGTAQGVGSVKGSIYDAVYEAERKDGASEAEAKAKALKSQEYIGSNIDQIVLGGVLGYAASSSGIERLLTKEGVKNAAPGLGRRVTKALIEEVPTEAGQGGQEQLAANLALQRTGRDVPTWQGVAGQATQEGLMAGLSAGPMAAVRSPAKYRDEEERIRKAEEQAAAVKQAQEEAARQAQFRQTPEYLDDLEKRFAALRETEAKLLEAARGKPDPNDPLAAEEKRRAKEALAAFKESDEYRNLRAEYTEAFDALRPRQLERQRQERVAAAPEGTQLDVFGEPAGTNDQSLPGQIKQLESYASSFDSQIKAAKKAGDTNQVALLEQKQREARDQIGSLLPDPTMLADARALAERRLEDYQTQIKDLTTRISDAANSPVRNAAQIKELEARLAALQKQRDNARNTAALVSPGAQASRQQQIEAQTDADIAQVQQQLEELKNPPAPAFDEINRLNEKARQVRSAMAEMDRAIQTAQKYRPTEVVKETVDKEKERAKLRTKLQQQADLGEDVGKTLDKIAALDNVQEQPDLFGEEDLRDIKPRDLGDLIADERARIKNLQSMAVMFAEQARQAQAQRGVVLRSKQELLEEARKALEQVRNRNAELANLEQLNKNLTQLGKQLRTLQGQNKPIPEWLTTRIARTRQSIDVIKTRLRAQQPVAEGQRELLPATDTGEFAPRVTDAEQMAQRDRDIAALLDKFLPEALGVSDTRETLDVPMLGGTERIDLVTLGGNKSDVGSLRNKLEEVTERRELATEALFEKGGASADALRSEIVALSAIEVDLRRQLAKLPPLSREYRQDLQQLVRDSFIRPPQSGMKPNLAEQRYLAAVADLRQVENDTLDAIYEMRKLEYRTRTKGIPGGSTADLVQNDPVMQAGMEAQRRIAAAQRAVDELAAAMPQLPDLTAQSLEDKLDTLVEEFSAGTPAEMAKKVSNARRVQGTPPAVLSGTEILAQFQDNRTALAELNREIQYAGRPTDDEKRAARDALIAKRDALKEENAALKERYNALQGAQPVEETGEVAEMRQELAKLDAALKSGQFNENPRIKQQMESARAELVGRIEAAVGPVQPEAEEPTGQRQLGQGIQPASLAGQRKPVDPQELAKARTAYVAATQKVEDIRKALARLDEMGPKYFQEVATTYQQNIDRSRAKQATLADTLEKLKKQQASVSGDEAVKLQQRVSAIEEQIALFSRQSADLERATKEVSKFLNLARLAGTGGDLRKNLEQALDDALADADKKKDAIADVEQRQRMYEQQEAARRGIDLGEMEAEKITSGQPTGFVTPRGKALGEKPKSKRSWIVSQDSKAPAPKPMQAGKMEAATQNAFELLAQAKADTAKAQAALAGAPSAESLTPIKAALERLEREIKTHYRPEQAAEIAKEITLLQERLAEISTAPAIANVAEKYQKATTAKRGLPAAERVAQMMFDASQAESKAAAALKVAEQQAAAAEQKYNASIESVKKAEKKLAKLKDPAKIRGIKLHIDNVYGSAQALRDGILDAQNALKQVEANYMAARLERLLLVQQMGEHAKTEAANLTARLASAADTVTALEVERDAALEREQKIRGKLTAAEAALEKKQEEDRAAKEAARNKAQREERAARNKALDEAAEAKKQALAVRQGLGLPGRRIERDTAGQITTAVQADIRRRLAEAETNLAKAMANGTAETITAATQKVKDITTELDQVYATAPVKVTEVGPQADKRRKESEDSFAPEPVEGMRLPPRRVGPSVRYVRGGNKAVMQAGEIKLRAAGLSQKAANAIGLYVKKNQIKGAKTAETKAARTAEYEAMTKDLTLEQVSEMLAEGQRLMGLGPTAELIAKREAVREAEEAVAALEKATKTTADPVVSHLARDELLEASNRLSAAERAYELAKDMYEMSAVKKAKKAERARVEELLEDAENEALAKSRTASAIGEADEDMFGTIFGDASVTLASQEVEDALRDGRLADALNLLAKEGGNDLLRRNAATLSPFVYKTKVVFKSGLTVDGKSVPAAYSSKENTIYFDADTKLSQEDVVHEATHAATAYALRLPKDNLTKEQQVAKNELTAMWQALRGDKTLEKQYGLQSLDEFASEMQSNADFRAAIGDRKWRGGSFLRRAFNLLLELVGLRRAELLTDKAEQYINAMYMQSRRFAVAKDLAAASRNSVLVADDESKYGSLKANLFGLGGRVQYVDRLGAADEAFIKAREANKLSSLEAENAQYFMRLADQVTQAAGQFITSGPVRLVKDKIGGNVEERYEASTGANLINVAQAVEDAAKAGLGSAQEVETMLTTLVAGDRANATPNGWQRLAGDKAASAKAEYEAYKLRVDGNPQAKKFIEQAKAEYKKYNDGLIDCVEQTGFLSKQEADNLRSKPYVPFYRVVKDEVRLYVDSANWVRIGDLKNNPDLQQFVGSNQKIMPILTSAVQNTFMLTRAAMHNKGTHETASALFKAGFASKFGPGRGPDSANVVRFKVKGQDYFAVIDSDAFGIPADLIVRGMEGMKIAMPEIVKMLGIPANWVRKFVTRGPSYIFRQLVREPIQAAIMQGVDGVPILNALQQMAKMRAGRSPAEEALMRGLVVSSNIYTGDEQDMQMFLRDISTGKGKWDKLLGSLDNLALQADAATRATLYEDSLKKGLTPRQAQFRALEAQNFGRRGLSPSMQMMRVMVPFFNAQIQGLDVLYRAMRGRLPFEEKLKLRDKMIKRGLLLAVTAMAYAMAMREDEKYKELPPEVRYGNFLFKLPGGTDYIKVPIPYELGIIFKALPEALLDAAINDTKATEAAMGVGKLLWQSAPGVVPVAVKPWVEATLNQTAYGPIEDRRMEGLPAGQRYREETPEVLKSLGSFTGTVGLSPRMLEHFANAYGSSLLLSVLRIPDSLLRDPAEGERASTPISKTAFVGGMFQSEEGRFAIDRAYAEMQKINQAVQGYEDLAKRGRRAEADAFAQRNADKLDAATMAGSFRQRMGEMFKAEREIRQSADLTTAQKDAMIKEIKEAQRREAKEFYAAVAQTKRQ